MHLGVVAVLAVLLVQASAHPLCTDYSFPTTPSPAHTFCKAYTESSCCKSTGDWTDAGIQADVENKVVDPDRYPDCVIALQQTRCARCDPYAEHLFGLDAGDHRDTVKMCDPYCRNFFGACYNVPVRGAAVIPAGVHTAEQFCTRGDHGLEFTFGYCFENDTLTAYDGRYENLSPPSDWGAAEIVAVSLGTIAVASLAVYMVRIRRVPTATATTTSASTKPADKEPDAASPREAV